MIRKMAFLVDVEDDQVPVVEDVEDEVQNVDVEDDLDRVDAVDDVHADGNVLACNAVVEEVVVEPLSRRCSCQCRC